MKRTFLAAFAAVALAAGGPAPAQQDFSKVEIKPTRLSPTVWMMEGAGGNLGVSAGEDTVFLVDDQYSPMTPKIEAALKAISAKPLRFVLNTHWHGDHTGGNENLGKTGAIIVAHENVRKRMGTEQFNAFFKSKTPPSPAVALPVVTFAQSISFHLNGEQIHVVHVPRAHTDGDSIVHFMKSDVVHMGDTFFNGMYPFIDASSGGSVAGVLDAVDQVLAMVSDKTKIIPGHGPLAGRAELQAYRDMLSTVSQRIREAITAGRSDEEIVKAAPTHDFDEKWGRGFLKPDQFVALLATSMRKPTPEAR